MSWIKELEDTYLIDVNCTWNTLAQSKTLRQGIPALWESAVCQQKIHGSNSQLMCQSLLDDLSSSFGCGNSIFGGKREKETKCSAACPLGIDVADILSKIRHHNKLEAARTLMKYDPMPEVTCRLCDGFCTKECAKMRSGDAVNIAGIMKSIGNYTNADSHIFFASPSRNSERKVSILGCGPAGLAAAYYLRRMGSKVTVYGPKPCFDGIVPDKERNTLRMISDYIGNLSRMGVKFQKQNYDSIKHLSQHERDEKTVLDFRSSSWNFADKNKIIQDIRLGCDSANQTNLDFGLKSFLETSDDFLTYDIDGVKNMTSKSELKEWKSVEEEASRCMNCGCYSVSTSFASPVLMALSAEVITDHNRFRAQDYFSKLYPAEQLKVKETLKMIEIPKNDDYHIGCIAHDFGNNVESPLILVYAFKYVKTGFLTDVRIVLGGAAPIPIRLFELEQTMRNHPFNAEDTMEMFKDSLLECENNKERVSAAHALFLEFLGIFKDSD